MLILAFIMGASFGSLVATNASRMKDRERIGDGISLCDHCGHRLALLDTIPILSFIVLRGRCRHCGQPIPRSTLWAELLGGVAFVVALWLFVSITPALF